MGRIAERPVALAGEVAVRPVLTLTVSVDHRVVDGVRGAEFLDTLASLAEDTRTLRPFVEEYRLRDGRAVVVLAEGRLVNLAAAEGHPPAVMDMSFAGQAFSVEYIRKNAKTLERRVYPVPHELDERIAKAKLDAMGMRIDAMTDEQRAYATSWKQGT